MPIMNFRQRNAIGAGVLLLLAAAPDPGVAGPEIRLAFGGDVMLGRHVDTMIRRHGPEWVWGDVRQQLRDADLSLVNLECTIAAGGQPFQPRRAFYFRADPASADTLTAAGIDYVSMANNHAMDYGAEALLETLGHLRRLRIAHAGAGPSLSAAAQPAWLSAGGLRVAVLSFADHFREYAATATAPGTQVIPVALEPERLAELEHAIGRLRAAGADLVVFSMHWGPNMRAKPSAAFIAFARAVITAGADIFHGHSAHLFQGLEFHGKGVILYDSGDLLDDYVVDPVLRNDLQLLFIVTAAPGAVHRVELLPLRIARRQVNRAQGPDRDWIERRIRELSAPFGTRIRRQGERLFAEPQ